MKKQQFQNPHIDTPKLDPSLYEPGVYRKVKDSNYFVQISESALEDKETFVSVHLEEFERLFKLSVMEAITRGLENYPLRSRIDTTKSIAIPLEHKETMTAREEFEKNVAAFKAMEHQLESDPQYQGKHVVIYKQNIVASGDDPDKLLSEAYQKYGYVPLIIHKVGERRMTRVYSPRYKT